MIKRFLSTLKQTGKGTQNLKTHEAISDLIDFLNQLDNKCNLCHECLEIIDYHNDLDRENTTKRSKYNLSKLKEFSFSHHINLITKFMDRSM